MAGRSFTGDPTILRNSSAFTARRTFKSNTTGLKNLCNNIKDSPWPGRVQVLQGWSEWSEFEEPTFRCCAGVRPVERHINNPVPLEIFTLTTRFKEIYRRSSDSEPIVTEDLQLV